MKRAVILTSAAAFALGTASLAFAAPEDLLPPGFGDPPPRPSPSPTRAPAATPTPGQPRPTSTSEPVPGSGEVVQPLPSVTEPPVAATSAPRVALPANFPSLAQLEKMEADEIDQLLGLRPKFDIPAAARRKVEKVGVIGSREGGFASGSLGGQPAKLVYAALAASDGPLVSRWGHILMRRVLSSRLDAPKGMKPVAFAALRARALNAMGEAVVARALVQDVDGSNYSPALTNAALDSYLATGDVLGMCPAARLNADHRDDGEWEMLQAICSAYLGDARSADRRLNRALGQGTAPEVDVRLAQRYAGAAGDGSRGVDIRWDNVEEMTPWRFALARALGLELPETLRESASAGRRYDIPDVLTPAVPLLERVSASDVAGAQGVLSSAAMVDLYSQLYASDAYEAADKTLALQLREGYVAPDPAARIDALRQLWNADAGYGRQVLTAYATARLPVSKDLAESDGAAIIASMLAAGLDRNAMRWSGVVKEGSQAWALLALANPQGKDAVGSGAVDSFIDEDSSAEKRKSRFLVAGLAGLGRIDSGDSEDFAERLGMNLGRQSAWSQRIEKAGELRNPALVALLAGLGMKGNSWDQMTARHLFHIVRALDRAGLSAEARMIAAEAVARG